MPGYRASGSEGINTCTPKSDTGNTTGKPAGEDNQEGQKGIREGKTVSEDELKKMNTWMRKAWSTRVRR